jgi:glycosyltransferase involved in cell wall biosynthesis
VPSIVGMTQSAFDPASRVRFIQYIPGLMKSGWQVLHRPNVPDRQWTSPLGTRYLRAVHYRSGRAVMKANRWRDVHNARKYDVVFVNRDLAGGGLFFERRLLRNNPNVVFDFDDAIFIGPNQHAVRWMCEHAAWVTPGNEYLAEFVRQHTDRLTIIPTVVDTERYTVRTYDHDEPSSAVRVGWSGSDQSIRSSLYPYLEMLARLQKKLDFAFVIITNTKPHLPVPSLRWEFRQWNVEEEYDIASTMDIGLMPLLDQEFQRGKCGLKLLQYMAAAIPTVASPVGVNTTITQHGRTGYLAATESDWETSLAELIQNPSLRAAMGTAGRKICDDNWSIKRWLPELISIFDRVRNAGR